VREIRDGFLRGAAIRRRRTPQGGMEIRGNGLHSILTDDQAEAFYNNNVLREGQVDERPTTNESLASVLRAASFDGIIQDRLTRHFCEVMRAEVPARRDMMEDGGRYYRYAEGSVHGSMWVEYTPRVVFNEPGLYRPLLTFMYKKSNGVWPSEGVFILAMGIGEFQFSGGTWHRTISGSSF
jgi:hypothetical protein